MVDQQQEELINKLFNAKPDEWTSATDNGYLMRCLLIPAEYKLGEFQYELIRHNGWMLVDDDYESLAETLSRWSQCILSPAVVKAVLDGDYFARLGFIIAGYDDSEFFVRYASW